MGDKMKKIIISLLFFIPLIAYSQEQKIGAHYSFSDDTDSSEIHKYTVDYLYNDYGFSYSYLNYKGDNYNFYGDRLGFLVEKENFNADIGFIDYNDHIQLDGYATYNNSVSDFLFYEFGVEHSPIDSFNGLNENLSATTLYSSVDLYSSYIDAGIALVPAITFFENNGERKQLRTKIYKGVGHGFHVYLRTRNYKNSKPDNGFFFSPEEYQQVLYGVGSRHYIWGGFLRTHIDFGYQKINSFREDSWTYRVAYKKDASDYDVYLSFEESEYSKFYTYQYGEIGIYYKF